MLRDYLTAAAESAGADYEDACLARLHLTNQLNHVRGLDRRILVETIDQLGESETTAYEAFLGALAALDDVGRGEEAARIGTETHERLGAARLLAAMAFADKMARDFVLAGEG